MSSRPVTLHELLRERQRLQQLLARYQAFGYIYLFAATGFGLVLAVVCGLCIPLNWHSWGQLVVTGACIAPMMATLIWLSLRVSSVQNSLYAVVKLIEEMVAEYP